MFEPAIGKLNTLHVVGPHDSGMMLDGRGLGEILLPNRYVPAGLGPGDTIEVFLMNDSEDRLVALTDRPLAMVGEFANLRVAATTRVGAFLDWGMPKELLLPFSEQARRVMVDDEVVVFVDYDTVSGRLYASTKLNKFVVSGAPSDAVEGQPVSLLVAECTDLGYKAIVNGRYWGLIHASSAAAIPFAIGDSRPGFISRVTDTGLVDVTFERPGYAKVPDAAQRLASALTANEKGFLPVNDKSSPDQIRNLLGMSKKVFKQALGSLYRDRKVRIEADGVHWIHPDSTP